MEVAQLDIFADSRDTMLRNDVLRALEAHAADRVSAALQTLRTEYPHEAMLDALDVLANALRRIESAPFSDHEALADEEQALTLKTEPAANQVFDAATARPWLAPLWRNLAQRSGHLGYNPQRPDCHAAPLWLAAGDWTLGVEAAGRVDSWRRIPAPLAWMTQARCHLEGLDAAWPLFAELAWLAPARFHAVAVRVADPTLNRLRKKFDADFEGEGGADDLAWFPAWALVDDNRLGPVLRDAQPALQKGPEQTMRAILSLLTLERQGAHHDLVNARRKLRDLHAGLYASYMKTR